FPLLLLMSLGLIMACISKRTLLIVPFAIGVAAITWICASKLYFASPATAHDSLAQVPATAQSKMHEAIVSRPKPDNYENYNPDSYLLGADHRVFVFDRSHYPYRTFPLTFPVGQWVEVKTATIHWDALPESGKPCTRAYFMTVSNDLADGHPRERNWCDQNR